MERPDDAILIVSLLDGRRYDPGRADAIATHDNRLLHPVFVQIIRLEGNGVFRSELENISDLNHPFYAERLAARNTGIACCGRMNVGELRISEVFGCRDASYLVSPLCLAPATYTP